MVQSTAPLSHRGAGVAREWPIPPAGDGLVAGKCQNPDHCGDQCGAEEAGGWCIFEHGGLAG